jgi:hypothetical protein
MIVEICPKPAREQGLVGIAPLPNGRASDTKTEGDY